MNFHLPSALMAVILFCQVAFVGTTFGTSVVCFPLFVLSAVIVFVRRRQFLMPDKAASPRWRRRALYAVYYVAILLACFGWRLSRVNFGSFNLIAVIVDVGSHAALISSLSVWVYRGWRGQLIMLVLGLATVLWTAAGGGISRSVVAQLSLGLLTGMAFMLASQMILGTRAKRKSKIFSGANEVVFSRKREVTDRQPRFFREGWQTVVFSMLSLSVILMATSVVATATNQALPGVQETLREYLNESFDKVASGVTIGTGNYVSGSQLGSVKEHMLSDPRGVALRGKSITAPGYLRGTTFSTFSSNAWHTIRQVANAQNVAVSTSHPVYAECPALVPLANVSEKGRNRFALVPTADEPVVKIELRNDPERGKVFFSSLGSRWIETHSIKLRVRDDGTIRTGIDQNQPYVLGTTDLPVVQELRPWQRSVYSEVPFSLRKTTTDLAAELCSDSQSARSKADAVAGYFQTNFEYSMDQRDFASLPNPLEYFLKTRHPAHCEYFATASTLVLRSAGVPTRYVTGYVMDEYNDEDSHWLARNSDAHAWVEAYDDAKGAWFSVESTPGRLYRTVSMQEANSVNELGVGVFNGDDQTADLSLFDRIVGWVAGIRTTDTLMVMLQIVQLPLFLFLVSVLIYRYRKSVAASGDPSDIRCRSILRKADRSLRRHELVRSRNETLHQFARRIEQQCSDPESPRSRELTLAAKWYRDFAVARFSGRGIDQLIELKQILAV